MFYSIFMIIINNCFINSAKNKHRRADVSKENKKEDYLID